MALNIAGKDISHEKTWSYYYSCSDILLSPACFEGNKGNIDNRSLVDKFDPRDKQIIKEASTVLCSVLSTH